MIATLRTLRALLTLTLSLGTGLLVAGCPNNSGSGAADGASDSTKSTTGGSGFSASGSSGGTGTSGSSVPKKATPTFVMVTAIAELAQPTGASGASGVDPNAEPPNFTLVFNATNTDNTLNDVCQAAANGGGGAAGSSGGNFDPAKACKCRYTWGLANASDASVITRVVETAPFQVTSFEAQCPGPDVYLDADEMPDNTIIKIQLVPDTAQGNNSGFQTNIVDFKKQPIGATGDFRDAEGHAFRNVFHYSCFDIQSKGLTITHKLAVAQTNEVTNTPINAFQANEFQIGGGAAPNAFSAQSYFYDFYVRSNEAGSINTGNASFSCPRVNVNGNPSFFPMDSQFAVALQKSKDFKIAIVGRTVVAPTGSSGAGDLIGFAAKPNADGTCPSFPDSSGRIRRTFRLRQYTTLYPIRYQATGDVDDKSQPNNTIYVLDRPVDKLGQDPLKPITRLGPKPCPFSFKTAQFGQKCMSDASLTGWSIDGVQIDSAPGCPIYPPVDKKHLKPDGTLVIRPYKAFVPHYLENTTLRACAFQSSIAIDPEIVLSHDDNIFPGTAGPSDFYCAKYYPASGSIIPPAGGDPFDKSPGDCDLAASAAALKTDKTYACSKTFDSTNSTVNTPAAGCCQICAGADCSAQGGGKTAPGRNAAFNPPHDRTVAANPPQAYKSLPRAQPNITTSGAPQGCFDPFED